MDLTHNKPETIINSVSPIRICDNGGWTDTWFAQHGKIFNIAVKPFVEIQIGVFTAKSIDNYISGKTPSSPQIALRVENYKDNYIYCHGKHWGKHPLIEATIEYMSLPKETACEITIYSDAPGGASMGTSAAVTVALIGALDRLKGGCMELHEVARVAHKIETELLHQQSGIQDQLCSAFGGINFIEMDHFPNASVETIHLATDIRMELERRLMVVYLGKSHNSSHIHEMVIRSLENAGPNCKPLKNLRDCAKKSRDALYLGDLSSFGEAMIENTLAQSMLHNRLVSPEAELIFEIACEHGALGWKVNGAGGDGGSVTILCDESSSRKRMIVEEITKENSGFMILPIQLSNHGLRVWTYKLSG